MANNWNTRFLLEGPVADHTSLLYQTEIDTIMTRNSVGHLFGPIFSRVFRRSSSFFHASSPLSKPSLTILPTSSPPNACSPCSGSWTTLHSVYSWPPWIHSSMLSPSLLEASFGCALSIGAGGGAAFHEVGRNSVCKVVCMASESDLVNIHKWGYRQ